MDKHKEIINTTFNVWIKSHNVSKVSEYLCVDEKHIEEAFFYDHRYDIGFIGEDIYVKDIIYPFKYTWNSEGFWRMLAPCIEDKCFIIWNDEQGYSWRFDFNGGVMSVSNDKNSSLKNIKDNIEIIQSMKKYFGDTVGCET